MITIDKSNSSYVIANFTSAVKKFNILIADKIKNLLVEIIDEDCGYFILDLENISYIDSSGFSVLISLFNYANKHDKKFVICGLSEANMKLVVITKLDNILNISANRDSAIEEVG